MVKEDIWELDHLNHPPIAWVKELVQVQKGIHLPAFPEKKNSSLNDSLVKEIKPVSHAIGQFKNGGRVRLFTALFTHIFVT